MDGNANAEQLAALPGGVWAVPEGGSPGPSGLSSECVGCLELLSATASSPVLHEVLLSHLGQPSVHSF